MVRTKKKKTMDEMGKADPKGTGYHYLYLRRPPGVGCQPNEWVRRESWLPSGRCGILCFGVVVYAEALSAEEIGRFELRPDPSRPIWLYETDKKIRQVYRRVHTVCERANARGDEYVGFQRLRAGRFRLIATIHDCGGRSSYNSQPSGLSTHDWAVNALYRLQEEGFISWNWPLDEWVDANFRFAQNSRGS